MDWTYSNPFILALVEVHAAGASGFVGFLDAEEGGTLRSRAQLFLQLRFDTEGQRGSLGGDHHLPLIRHTMNTLFRTEKPSRIQGVDIRAIEEGTRGPALLYQRLLPADSEYRAGLLLPRAGQFGDPLLFRSQPNKRSHRVAQRLAYSFSIRIQCILERSKSKGSRSLCGAGFLNQFLHLWAVLSLKSEGDIKQNSPSVQFEANMAQDRLRANREIGRRGWQCLSPRKALAS